MRKNFMKHQKKQKGLTLIELVLAITILSFMSVAMSALNLSATRMTASASVEIQLQNELNYILRDIEINLRPGKNPVVSSSGCPDSGTSCITVTDPSDDEVVYSYNSVTRRLSRTVNGVTERLSEGVLILRSGAPSVFFMNTNNLIEINFAAERDTAEGRIISVPGVTKSIFLRGTSS